MQKFTLAKVCNSLETCVTGDNGANQTTGSNGGPPQKAPVNPWGGVEMINDTDTKFVLKLLVVSFAGTEFS